MHYRPHPGVEVFFETNPAASAATQAARSYYEAHPLKQEADGFATLANALGVPAVVASVPLVIDGATRIQEAPTTSQTVIGAAEIAAGVALWGGGVLLERARQARYRRAKSVVTQQMSRMTLAQLLAAAGRKKPRTQGDVLDATFVEGDVEELGRM